ncbi:MAG: hypothetical protein ACTHK7_15125 [Aureliella sp.]
MQSDINLGNPNHTGATSQEPHVEGGPENAPLSSAVPAKAAELASVRPVVEVDTTNPSATAPAEPSDAAMQLAEDLKKFEKVAAEIRASLAPAEDFDERCNQAFSLANDLFGHAPTWVCFFREVMAVDGLTRTLFSTDEEYGQFMTTSHYDQLLQMLTALRSRDLPENDPNDPQRMITVRLPKSLHEALCDEAGRLNISVNKLCISRLLQVLDQKMVPATASKPRGRKPRSRTKTETETNRSTAS